MKVLGRGLLLRLPIIDTDPNRGITVGFMPIWVLEDPAHRVRHIHAPSVDYNHTYGATATYRYFFYPKEDAALNLRGSISEVVGRELLLKYDDRTLKGGRWAAGVKAQYNKDGSYRYYGTGPDTQEGAQTNYTWDVLGYRAYAGYPVLGRLYLNAGQRLQGIRIVDGPISSVASLSSRFPEQEARHRHQDLAHRLFLTYDTRDNADTTTRGVYLEAGAETAQRRLAAEHTYQQYSLDARGFIKTPIERRLVTALRLDFEQQTGPPAPFWLGPSLGGKYSLRAYGEGRFTDRGLLLTSLEQRVLVYRTKVAKVWTELEAAPFVEAGTVFSSPERMAWRYLRPAYGAAFRVVARPQIVGSVDFGYGQEGLSSFVDINYSF
jgi:outer membrane protein assembly factor BamA